MLNAKALIVLFELQYKETKVSAKAAVASTCQPSCHTVAAAAAAAGCLADFLRLPPRCSPWEVGLEAGAGWQAACGGSLTSHAVFCRHEALRPPLVTSELCSCQAWHSLQRADGRSPGQAPVRAAGAPTWPPIISFIVQC